MASSHGSSTAGTPAQFGTQRRAGRLGPLHIGHVVVIEVVAVALLGASAADHGRPGLWVALTGAGSALVLIAAFGRSRGRWWYEGRVLRGRWRRRRRTVARGTGLAVLGPGLAVREVVDRGTRIGVGQDEDGWFAVLAVGRGSGVWGSSNGNGSGNGNDSGNGSGGIRLDRLAAVLTDAAVPVSSVSVVSQCVPAPNAVLDRQSRAAQSYRKLLHNDLVLADQAVWVAVRLSAADATDAAASRGGGLDGVDRAIAAALGRVGKTLAAADLSTRVLDPGALTDALATSSGLAGGGSPPGAEEWTAWYAGGIGNVGFWLARWPKGPVTELFGALTRVPAALVSIAVTLYPPVADGQLRVACLVRVAAEPNVLAKAAADVVAAARQVGARLRRLDGEHGPATYATLPTAAGTR